MNTGHNNNNKLTDVMEAEKPAVHLPCLWCWSISFRESTATNKIKHHHSTMLVPCLSKSIPTGTNLTRCFLVSNVTAKGVSIFT